MFSLNPARGCRLAWSRLVDLGSIDPGSNPGSPTTPIFILRGIRKTLLVTIMTLVLRFIV
jgi:hypothetical protein